jgi:hypothetical protein
MATENKITLTSLREVIVNAMNSESKTEELSPNELKAKSKDFFICKLANEWVDEAKTRAIPKMLLSEFWFEGELCILFSDTNLGKSILAVQIANIISKGEKASGFKMEAEKQKVLYFDFELTNKQFQNRYSDEYENEYQFDDNFMRVELNPDMDIPKGMNFEDCLYKGLEKLIIETGSKILIVDNITFLKTETENAKNALPLMKQLKELKSKHGLSMLVLAHCPKRDLSKPITRNDLAGSKMLINFCDSSFTIGESNQDKSFRYLKQIKQRNSEHIYDSENVIVCQIFKDFNYLHFKFIDFGSEHEHLRCKSSDKNDSVEVIEEAKKLYSEGLTQRQVADKLRIGVGTANKYINS